jgi:hypothetical protein
MFCI